MPQDRQRQRQLVLSALALRLLRQPRANAATGLSQRFSCNEALVSPLSGLKRMPFGQSIFIPTLHPGRAKRVLPLVGPVVPTLASPPSLRYPAFRFRSLCSLHLHSGRSRSSAAQSRRCSLDARTRVSPSLTLRASRPPSKRSARLFFLVCFFWF